LNSTDEDNEGIDNLIIVDLEDTVLDTMSGFVKWLGKHNRLTNITGKSLTSRDEMGSWLGVDDSLAANWMREFCEQSWEWGALHPYLDSQKVIPALVKCGWDFIGVARGSSKVDRGTLRRANLELTFPRVFTELYAMSTETNIYPLLKDFSQIIFITANEHVALTSANAGHITYLLDQPWNKEFNNLAVKRFSSWEEIYFALENLQEKLA
jgi:hypothetical protein